MTEWLNSPFDQTIFQITKYEDFGARSIYLNNIPKMENNKEGKWLIQDTTWSTSYKAAWGIPADHP